ncbi:MAG: cytochrome C, partial [Verrucomicrobia bacterium]
CMNCHTQVAKDNPKLEPVRASWKTGDPIDWVWIHRTVDYVYYNHAAHVNRGISCFSCHGPVNHMSVVYQAKPHSMAWCLECHRHPENFLRPEDQVFNLDWNPEDVKPAEFVAKYGKPHGMTEDWSKRKTLSQTEIGQTLKERWNITPPQNCQGCHR